MYNHRCLFHSSGQVCIAPTRIFVHEDVYDAFIKKSVELAKARLVGNPMDNKYSSGPQVTT